MKRFMAVILVLATGIWFVPIPALGKEVKAQPAVLDKGLAAIERAANAKKYLYIFFFKGEDENTRNMRKVFEAAASQAKDRADSIAVNINDPAEKGIVNKFRVMEAPMPLALVMAPNGVITAGYPTTFTQDMLLNAFASPVQEKALKALQERKLVFLCVQNNLTKSNTAAMQGVHDFKNDVRYTQDTEIITLDPADVKEAKFLKIWDINPKPEEAITLLLSPPGSTIGKFTGATDKKKLEATLQAALSGGSKCCPTSGGAASKDCTPKK